ncbi:MAG: glycosyltransferase family 39 protein [Acidobacteria bacterium]|nr:glycosyltransferase family 39 protein [Acidobacteriota bacterium]
MRRLVLTLALLSSFTFFLGLGRPAISDSDEGFYAEAAREMAEGGDWLTPHFNYEERWQKPVLYYWLTAVTYVLAGPSEWTARWWSALSGLGLVLLTWAAARRITVHDDAAWLAGAIVATCYGYFAMARLALPDLPLTFCITLTIWAALERRWVAAGGAAGLGLLMKGPVALVVPALVLAPIWWRERRTAPVRVRDLATAAAVCAVVGLPWYGAMTLRHGVAYLHSFLVGDNLERFATNRFNEPRAIWFYLPILVGGMLPWSAYLVALPWRSATRVARGQRRLTDMERRLLLWAFVPLLFFTISIGKQPRYILPVLPPLAILLARSIATRTADAGNAARTGLAIATWGTAALYAAVAILLYRAKPLFITAYPVLTSIGVALIAASAVVLAWIAASRRWRRLPAVATICAAVLLLSVQFGTLAGTRPEPVEQMATLVLAHRASGEPVGTYQVFVRSLVFYTRFKQVELFNEGVALDFLTSPEPVLLVVRAADLPRLEAISGVTARRLGQVRYLDTAKVRLRTLVSPIPEQNLETVLLVTNR